MSEITKNEKNFVGYEHKDIAVSHESKSVYADGYPHFGWTLEGTTTLFQKVGTVNMKFKRDRKIRNKVELTRLQRQFEACVTDIEKLERSKLISASAIAYGIGIAGTACMAGSVFAYLADLLPLTVILAIPGFAGWIVPYFSFRGIRNKKTQEVTPFIDMKQEEIYEVCEKANALLTK